MLGGTLGENAAWCIGHVSSAQADGCDLVSRRVLRSLERLQQPSGEANVSPPRIFPRTLINTWKHFEQEAPYSVGRYTWRLSW